MTLAARAVADSEGVLHKIEVPLGSLGPGAPASLNFLVQEYSTVSDLFAALKRASQTIESVSALDGNGARFALSMPLRALSKDRHKCDMATLVINDNVRLLINHAREGALPDERRADIAHAARLDELLSAAAPGKLHIAYAEALAVAARAGLSEVETLAALHRLHDSGRILFYGDSHLLSDTIFLKPERVRTGLRATFHGLTASERAAAAAERTRVVNLLVERLQPLVDRKEVLDRRAARFASTIMWGGYAFAAGQLAFIARLTWWEFSWDVMEPISYCLGVLNVSIFYAFYLMRGADVDSYASLEAYFTEKRKRRLYRRYNLDLAEHEILMRTLEHLEASDVIDAAAAELVAAGEARAATSVAASSAASVATTSTSTAATLGSAATATRTP